MTASGFCADSRERLTWGRLRAGTFGKQSVRLWTKRSIKQPFEYCLSLVSSGLGKRNQDQVLGSAGGSPFCSQVDSVGSGEAAIMQYVSTCHMIAEWGEKPLNGNGDFGRLAVLPKRNVVRFGDQSILESLPGRRSSFGD